MKKSTKNKSAAPGMIVIGSLITSIATANPMPFVFGISFVWLFDDKFGRKYDRRTGRRIK